MSTPPPIKLVAARQFDYKALKEQLKKLGITVADLADLFCISKQAVYKQMREGNLFKVNSGAERLSLLWDKVDDSYLARKNELRKSINLNPHTPDWHTEDNYEALHGCTREERESCLQAACGEYASRKLKQTLEDLESLQDEKERLNRTLYGIKPRQSPSIDYWLEMFAALFEYANEEEIDRCYAVLRRDIEIRMDNEELDYLTPNEIDHCYAVLDLHRRHY